MGGLLPPVIATLIADTKQYTAEITGAEANMTKFGVASETTGAKMTAFGKKATTAVAGFGIAMVAYGVDKALKYTKALDDIQNQAGASASELDYLKGVILTVSSQTAISSDQIAGAFLQVEKAGIRGKAAYNLVDNAAKAAAITGGDVAAIATTIVAAQSLQITKGQSVAQVTDTLVKANQNHIGSLDNLVSLLKGRVGGALAAYGINLGEAASVADIASKAGYNNARSMTTLATGLGKVENPTKAQTKALAAFGINAEDLARKARTPGTGLIDTLKSLEVQSQKTGIPLEKLVTATFGAGAVGLVSALAKQFPALATLNTSLQSSSAKGLDTAFGITSKQLNFKIAQIKTQFENALTGIGLVFLPTLTDLANWSANAVKFFKKHPLMQTIATDSAISLFVGAILFKLGQGISGVVKSIRSVYQTITKTSSDVIAKTQGATQISLLTEIAANTLAMSGELGVVSTEAGLIAGTSATTATEAGIIAAEGGFSKTALLQYLPEIALILGTAFGLKNFIVDPVKKALQEIKDTMPGGSNGQPVVIPGVKPPKTIPKTTLYPYAGQGMPGPYTAMAQVTPQQYAAISQYLTKHNISMTSDTGIKDFNNALNNFSKQDLKGNYSVVVNVK